MEDNQPIIVIEIRQRKVGLAQAQLAELRAGDLCPACGLERLDYDGLLNLSCPRCGMALGGCFT
jgi:hypothetical protein